MECLIHIRRDWKLVTETTSLMSWRMETFFTLLFLRWTLATLNSPKNLKSTEMVLKMSLSWLMMPEVSMKRLSEGELRVLESQRNYKMIMAQLLLPPSKLMVTLTTLSLKEKTLRECSFQALSPIILRKNSIASFLSLSLKLLTTVLATKRTTKWNLPLNGTKRCWTSTDSGPLMTQLFTHNTLLWDLSSWQILTKM